MSPQNISAQALVRQHGGSWKGDHGKIVCPSHDDHDPSLKIWDKPHGQIGVYCFAGCEPRVVKKALGIWRQRVPLKSANKPRKRTALVEPEPDDDAVEAPSKSVDTTSDEVARKFEELEPVKGTLAETYLNGRGIEEFGTSLRFDPKFHVASYASKYGKSAFNGKPCMVAPIHSRSGDIVAVLVTALKRDGSGKFFEKNPRRQLGSSSGMGAAIRLDRGDVKMLFAEGVETALSGSVIAALPAWASNGTGGMKSLVPPPECEEAIILGDNGDPGHRAAEEFAARLLHSGLRVRIAYPAEKFSDWNDALCAEGFDMEAAEHEIIHAPVFKGKVVDELLLDPGTPLISAQRFIDREYRVDGVQALRFWRGSWHLWSGQNYPEVDDREVKGKMYWFLNDAYIGFDNSKEPPVKIPFNPTKAKVENVLDALKTIVHLSKSTESPSWFEEKENQPSPRELIACNNGLLHIQTEELRSHDPNYFNVNVLPYDYDPDAPKSPSQNFILDYRAFSP